MSRIHTPPSLKWYIDKRARLLGEISKLEDSYPKRLEEAKSEIGQAELRLHLAKEYLVQLESSHQRIIEALRSDIQALDRSFSYHEIQINPEVIPQIRSHSAEKLLPYGAITRSIYEALKLSGGRPLNTLEITDYVISSNELDIPETAYQLLRRRISNRLKNLCLEGAIRRLHLGKKAAIGVWALPIDTSVPIPVWTEKVLRPRKNRT